MKLAQIPKMRLAFYTIMGLASCALELMGDRDLAIAIMFLGGLLPVVKKNFFPSIRRKKLCYGLSGVSVILALIIFGYGHGLGAADPMARAESWPARHWLVLLWAEAILYYWVACYLAHAELEAGKAESSDAPQAG
jgi:sterol desaturase/sphingolipid hydroxylase (fatty acid hydroxylase superfamily)